MVGGDIRPYVYVSLNGMNVECLVDTGACVTLVSENVYERVKEQVQLSPTGLKLITLTGTPIETVGEGSFQIEGLEIDAVVVRGMPVSLVIGTDTLRRYGGQVDYKGSRLVLGGLELPYTGRVGRSPGVACTMTKNDLANIHKQGLFYGSDKGLSEAIGVEPMAIETTGGPTYQRPYRAALTKRHVIDEAIDEMLKDDIIEPSSSPWASPVTLAPKKDGWRFCVDYRALNEVTKKDRFPLPHIQDIFDTVGQGSVFTTLDLKSGYWQMPMRQEDREKTAFVCHRGQYQYKRVSFGLANAPAYFQRVMSHILAPLLGKSVLVYIDDLIVFSKDLESHKRDLSQVFELLKVHNLQLKESKCVFARPSVDLLGYHIDGRGISPLSEKTSAIADLPPPRTVQGVRSFLGMSGYYRQCVPHYAHVAEPLVKLTRRGVDFCWGPDQDRAFNQLKRLLTSAIVMAHPEVNKPYRLHTDASDYAIGAILCQVDDQGVERVVQYISHQLNPIQRRWATIEKEAYAVVYALQKLRPYLLGADFVVYTDHKPLKSLFTKQMNNTKIQRWAVLLAEYGAKIEYRKGRDNVRADMLSRITSSAMTESLPIAVITRSMSDPVGVSSDDITTATRYGLKGKEVRKAQIEEFPAEIEQALFDDDSDYSYCNKLLRTEQVPYKGAEYIARIVLPEQWRASVIAQAHTASGHSGPTKTLKRIWEDFTWKGIRGDVRRYLRQCGVCQVHRTDVVRTHMHDVEVPPTPMQMVGIDFIGPFVADPMGCRYVLTIIDYHSGWVEAYRTIGTTTGEVIDTLVQEFFPRHGIPRILVADNASCFTSAAWNEFIGASEIELRHSTPYHPQGNSRVERFNGTLKRLIAKACNNRDKDWYLHVNAALAAYRTSVHESTGYSPFYLLYGRRAQVPLERFLGAENNIFGNRLDDLAQAYRKAKVNQERNRANNRRRIAARANADDALEVGDTVIVKAEVPLTHAAKWDPQYEVYRIEGTTHFIRHQITGKERRVHREKLLLVDPDIAWDEVPGRPRRQRPTKK